VDSDGVVRGAAGDLADGQGCGIASLRPQTAI
jgi:hypothetical protein